MSSEESKNADQGGGEDRADCGAVDVAGMRVEFEAKLLAQEHRLFPILRNWVHYRGLVKRRKIELDDPRVIGVREALLWRIVVALMPTAAAGGISLTAILAVVMAYKANVLFEEQNKKIQVQNLLIEGQRRSTLIFELSRVLDLIHEHTSELEEIDAEEQTSKNPNVVQLPEHVEGRIVALSRRLEPYHFIDPETGKLTEKPLSPERGQLLIALIKSKVWMDYDCHFMSADLRRADLTRAHLFQAQLGGANLAKSRCVMSNLCEAYLSGADLQSASFGGADVRRAHLYRADLRFAQCGGADFSDSRFGKADLRAIQLLGTNLQRAFLGEADLRYALFGATNLIDAKLTKAKVHRLDWIEMVQSKNVTGLEEWEVNPMKHIDDDGMPYYELRRKQPSS